jgi:autotransporter-associated beta strand protein
MKNKLIILAPLTILIGTHAAFAGSATWNLNPTSGDWLTSANWTPATVPNGPADIATFAASSVNNVSLSANAEVSGIVFNSGASGFTITPNPGTTFTISGAGITNSSGMIQTLVSSVDANFNHGFLVFSNNATAGDNTTIIDRAATTNFSYGGNTFFAGNSNAGSATFITEGGAVGANIVGGVVTFGETSSAGNATFITGGGTKAASNGGEVGFFGTLTAANGTFINNPATAIRAQGGFVEVENDSTGADATFINNGATVSGAGGGVTAFYEGSNAGNCTLIANGGSNGGRGGEIWFYRDSFGGTPRVQVFGNGFLDTSSSNVAIGSLEGDGDVFVGSLFPLAVGTNNFDSVFSGRIRDNSFSGGGGAVKKVGTGTLTLTGASTHIGGFTVAQGRLEISNRRGSGTGSGPVRVRGGKLGGRGIIAGPVTVGTATGPQGILSPGRTGTATASLTIQDTLTFDAKGVYSCNFFSDIFTADEVVANGVTIGVGAVFHFEDIGSPTLSQGTVFTIINNTSATAITGTFSDLADGGLVVDGSNTFQANYEGGDGNDLTLTVVQ